ncbi:MAG: TonB family protein [Verrucomicrobia bacterium]|nr:TonB family protein [Verrucomicrobiota bacterium]
MRIPDPGDQPSPQTTEPDGAACAGVVLWPDAEDSASLPALTLLLWVSCLLVGLLGFVLSYERPHARQVRDEPLLAQQLQVDLSPSPPPDSEPQPPDPSAPPPPPDTFAPPAITRPIAVAQPSPAIAFALPVAGRTRVVEASRAEYVSGSVGNAQSAPPPVRQLTLGEGEGNQPKPNYPRQAERQRQEGTVVVRLSVGEDGRVLQAEAVESCPWPLLNEAALKVVRERWHFPAGPARLYEVAIRFQIAK